MIRRLQILLFLLAAFTGWLPNLRAALPTLQKSVETRVESQLATQSSETWELVDVQPYGFTDDGTPLALFVFVELPAPFDMFSPVSTRAGPETHTRVLYVVQPILGLYDEEVMWAIFAVKYGEDGLGMMRHFSRAGHYQTGSFAYGGNESMWLRKQRTQSSPILTQDGRNSGFYQSTLFLSNTLTAEDAADRLFSALSAHNRRRGNPYERSLMSNEEYIAHLQTVPGLAVESSMAVARLYVDGISNFVPGFNMAEAIRGETVTGQELASWQRVLSAVPATAMLASLRQANNLDDAIQIAVRSSQIPLGPSARTMTARNTVWSLGPSPRGQAIEKAWGHNLPSSFKTWDRFDNGVATSIKSIDLDLIGFSRPNRIWNAGRRHVDAAIDFTSYSLQGVRIDASMITERTVRIALPRNPVGSQLEELNRVIQYGADNGIRVIWEVF